MVKDRCVRTFLLVIEEKGVRLTIEVLESVGFGDFINNDARCGGRTRTPQPAIGIGRLIETVP